MKKLFAVAGMMIIVPLAVWAANDISHTPLVSTPLLSTDRVPMGRPSSGAANGQGTPYTVNMGQISTFVQGQLSSAGKLSGAGITKTSLGLGNVDNTSDAAKPISTAQQTALDLKAPLASPTFTGTVAGITKSMVGLGNVDNTADTAKPISTATQTALDAKLDSTAGVPISPASAYPATGDTTAVTPDYVEAAVAAGGGGSVTEVTATDPVISSGGTAPVISMAAATDSVPGYMTAADHTSLTGKLDANGITTTSGIITTPKASGTADKITLANANGTEVTGAGLMGPATTMANSYWLQLPATEPTNGQVLLMGTPASHVVPTSWATAGADATKLPLSGGTMSGDIVMATHKITGLGNGSSAQDAAAFGQIPTNNSGLTNGAGYITATSPEIVVTGGTCSTSYNVNPVNGTMVNLTLSGACNVTATTLAAGQSFTLYMTQSSTTAPTFSSAFKWAAGTAPTWSATATKYDTVACASPDGTKLICNAIVDGR